MVAQTVQPENAIVDAGDWPDLSDSPAGSVLLLQGTPGAGRGRVPGFLESMTPGPGGFQMNRMKPMARLRGFLGVAALSGSLLLAATPVAAATLVLRSTPFGSIAAGLFVNVSNDRPASITVTVKLFDSEGVGFDLCDAPVVLEPGKSMTCGNFFKVPIERQVFRVEVTADDPTARRAADVAKQIRVSLELTDELGRAFLHIVNFSE
jgi:hypothetical protein